MAELAEITPGDVFAWMNKPGTASSSDQQEMAAIIASETGRVVGMCVPLADNDVDGDAQAAGMRTAILIWSARTWARKNSPLGMTAAFDGVAPVTLTRFDGDAERQIARWNISY